ncbi:MAG: polysaccharide biosynthesis protein [Lachnospiraceae bacterium]|nr:polysaccharide biosynthesis protein [Lachnospiraceae bacterium]
MGNQKKKTNDILKQGTILAAASIIVRIIGLVYRIPLGNLIGDEGNGIYSLAYGIYSLALIVSSYGLPLAVSKMVAAKNVNREYRNAYKIFLNALVCAAVTGGIVGGGIYFGADFFAGLMKSQDAAMPLRVLAPTIFCVAILGVFRGFFQGQNTMVPTAFSQIAEQIINAIVSYVAAYQFIKAHSEAERAVYGATGSTWGTFMGSFVALLLLIGVFFLYRPVIKKRIRHDRHREDNTLIIYKILLATILPVIISQTVYQISGTLDTFLFHNIMAGREWTDTIRNSLVGVYSTQYNILLSVPLGISTAMGTSMIPSIVSSFTESDMRTVKYKVKSVVKFNMIIAFPSAVGLAVLAGPILTMLYPRLVTYHDTAANLLLFGSVALVFYALSTVTSGVLQGIDKMRLPMMHSAVSLAIHVVLVTLLLKFTNLGIYALIIGNVTFPLVVCILNWLAVGKHLAYHQEVRSTFLLPCLAALIMGVVCFLGYRVFYFLIGHSVGKFMGNYISNLISTLLTVAIAVVTYFAVLLYLRAVNEEELKDMPMGRTLYTIGHKLHLI